MLPHAVLFGLEDGLHLRVASGPIHLLLELKMNMRCNKSKIVEDGQSPSRGESESHFLVEGHGATEKE